MVGVFWKVEPVGMVAPDQEHPVEIVGAVFRVVGTTYRLPPPANPSRPRGVYVELLAEGMDTIRYSLMVQEASPIPLSDFARSALRALNDHRFDLDDAPDPLAMVIGVADAGPAGLHGPGFLFQPTHGPADPSLPRLPATAFVAAAAALLPILCD